jgi:hypothetical protein
MKVAVEHLKKNYSVDLRNDGSAVVVADGVTMEYPAGSTEAANLWSMAHPLKPGRGGRRPKAG